MTADTLLTHARVITAAEVIKGTVVMRDGRIAAIDHGSTALPGAVDLEGDLLIPGLVELHTDNFERHLLPRPKVSWPALVALLQHDAEIAAAGITTVHDAICVGESELCGLRGRSMREVLEAIENAAAARLLRADHRVHVRCELPSPLAPDQFAPFEGHPLVGLISLMDHTPGRGQWRDIDRARAHYAGKYGAGDRSFDTVLAEAPRLQQCHAVANRRFFAAYARENRIPLASHDDALASEVTQAGREGVAIAEFPTTLEAARQAQRLGLAVVMGAPNIIQGESHAGNVPAMAVARAHLLDILSSDYVPGSLLLAAFRLAQDARFPLPKAIAAVSRTPARAVGLTDRGEIAEGKRADLVRVHVSMKGAAPHPVVRAVWRAGERVS